MKNRALFSSKDKSKKLKWCLLQLLFGALRVKVQGAIVVTSNFGVGVGVSLTLFNKVFLCDGQDAVSTKEILFHKGRPVFDGFPCTGM